MVSPAPVSPPGRLDHLNKGDALLTLSPAEAILCLRPEKKFQDRLAPMERIGSMNVQERIGCFFLAIGFVLLLLYALPIVQAFQRNPATVPLGWLGIAGVSIFLLWTGSRLYLSAKRNAPSQKSPSLAARLMARGKSDDEKDE
jgi:hypothetical protein